jgi:predicted phosphodiesterase
MRKTGRKKAKIAVISCTHSPFTPEKTHEWILQELSGIPDITHFGHLGDVFEAGAASRRVRARPQLAQIYTRGLA